tara:strand:+ start:4251 stop:4925 length:675 start_codon:yes stop_codon:yes gene_type:complete
MSFIAAGAAATTATLAAIKMVQGGIQAKKAREDAAVAKAELDKGKDMFSNIDTSNPYQNLENTMEDLTVNKQAAEFQKQQQMQGQANIMQQMRGAAGGSGIAALAQSMAQQGSMDAQKASAGIGQQEAANQKAERGMAGDIQNKEREGDMLSRNMQFGKISSMMGMSAGELQGANARLQAGQAAMYEGGQDMASGAVDYGVNTGEIDPNAAYGTGVNTNAGGTN